MFIQVQDTPNPATLKFLPGMQLLEPGYTVTIQKANVKDSPLAEAIFEIEGVNQVFLSNDFISVTKESDQDWDLLKTRVLAAIMDHLVAGLPVLANEANSTKEFSKDVGSDPKDKEIVGQIEELVETRVRPAVAQDGGDIIFKGFRDGIVYLELHGSCSGCPSSIITLKNGIENMLKHYIPEVSAVEAI